MAAIETPYIPTQVATSRLDIEAFCVLLLRNMATNLLSKVTTSKTEIPTGRRAGERGGLQSLIRSLKELPPDEALRVHKDYGKIDKSVDPEGTARQKMLYSSLQFASRRTGIKINCQVTSDGTGDVLVWMRGAR